MATFIHNLREVLLGRDRHTPRVIQREMGEQPRPMPVIDIAPDDLLVAYFLSTPGAIEIDRLNLDSPAVAAIRAAGVKIVVPLVSQGELVGLLNLGARRSERDYSAYDRILLNTLATQVAPAIRVAQLIREQQLQARSRERLEQELRVARLIQQTLLPKDLPTPPGWRLAAYWTPARAVGGDFYDFLRLKDGRLGLIIGDVTDKGIPAALVMATTRSILRAAAQDAASPGEVLERANDLLHPDIPPRMFVTCLYAILDPASGSLRYANAGHDLPYRRHLGHVSQLRATGMPLGLMPAMRYEEKETMLVPGESILLYSDGLVEAHNQKREMFGFARLTKALEAPLEGAELIDSLLAQLVAFIGAELEQEDDVTMVLLQRLEEEAVISSAAGAAERLPASQEDEDTRHVLAAWSIPSIPGNERLAMEQVAQSVATLHLAPQRLERLKTAVAEATMNAMEHGNRYQPHLPVFIEVVADGNTLSVSIKDQGGHQPVAVPQIPDLEAKLAELQAPRGWGLFLIQNLVDEMHITGDETQHIVELIVHREEENHGGEGS